MTTMVDVGQLLGRALSGFGRRLDEVGDGSWSVSTPCADWDVRALVNHVAGEVAWISPLLAGQTIEQVGDRLDGDLLGGDPRSAWRDISQAARDAAQREGALERDVHVSAGEVPASGYLAEVIADVTIHTWDLARAIGADEDLDRDLVELAGATLQPQVGQGRQAGFFAAPIEVPADASPQTRLLALLGRRAGDETAAVIERFTAAINRHDIDAAMAAMTEDCIFEGTTPPDGDRHEGHEEVRACFVRLFESATERSFDTEELFTAGDRAVVRWYHRWVDLDGRAGNVRGVDVFRVRDGKVAEKLSYVKG